MKARRIATRRIGEDDTSPDIDLIWFSVIGGIVTIIMIVASTIGLRFSDSREVAQVAVPTTTTPTQTAFPTMTPTPTALPTTPTPLPTVAVERGVMRAQVWLYDAPGGDQVTAGLLAGHQVTILERRDEFAKVRWEGESAALEGWVAEKWIETMEVER